MTEENTQLEVNKSNQVLNTDIKDTIDDIKSLNIPNLKKATAQGLYLLQTALFSQAEKERNRLSNLNDVRDMMESIICHKDNFLCLDPEDQIKLFKAIIDSQKNSLTFLTNLHKNLPGTIDALNSIEELKQTEEAPKKEIKSSKDVNQIKQALLKAMEIKIKEQKEGK